MATLSSDLQSAESKKNRSSRDEAGGYSYLVDQPTSARAAEDLSIALIGPDLDRRSAVARELASCAGNVREFHTYPMALEAVQQLADENFDAILIDLDADPAFALMMVESICAMSQATVMVYSSSAQPDVLLRSMRAGAREFFALPFHDGELAEALIRAAARRPAKTARNTGKLLVFMGAKGGVGVTSVACNFAVALAQEEGGRKTILIDLDLPLGDAALNLGIVPEYSTVNALKESDRLDANLLSKLLVRHSSGVWLLAAPGRFPGYQPAPEAINKLLSVARQEFDNVVVDVGSRVNLPETALFSEASTIYLVTQAGIPELRNSNRLINQFFKAGGPKLEVVLNRYESRTLGVAEEHIAKALTRPAEWKVPNDHTLMRKMQINATPLVLADSAVSRLIKQMARSVHGVREPQAKKKFSLFD